MFICAKMGRVKVIFAITGKDQFKGTNCMGCSKWIECSPGKRITHKNPGINALVPSFQCKKLLDDKNLHKENIISPDQFPSRMESYVISVMIASKISSIEVKPFATFEFKRSAINKESYYQLFIDMIKRLVMEKIVQPKKFEVRVISLDRLFMASFAEEQWKHIENAVENVCNVFAIDPRQLFHHEVQAYLIKNHIGKQSTAFKNKRYTCSFVIKPTNKRNRDMDSKEEFDPVLRLKDSHNIHTPKGLADFVCDVFDDPTLFPIEQPNHPTALAYAYIRVRKLLYGKNKKQ